VHVISSCPVMATERPAIVKVIQCRKLKCKVIVRILQEVIGYPSINAFT
jgi:hypothetical protein